MASVWTDRVSKTLTYEEIAGDYAPILLGKAVSAMWVYFEFDSLFSITTDPSKYRVKFLSTDNGAYIARATSTPSNAFAVVTTLPTFFSTNDDIVLNNKITFRVDQDIECAGFYLGNDSSLKWEENPVSSYSLKITDLWMGCNTEFNIGSEDNPIPYEKQAEFQVTTLRAPLVWAGDVPYRIKIYGEKPEGIKTTSTTTSNTATVNLATQDDMSDIWQVGDNIICHSGLNSTSRTITYISGKDISINGTAYPSKDYPILNATVWEKCGVKGAMVISRIAGNPHEICFSGVFLNGGLLNIQLAYNASQQQVTSASIEKIKPVLLEYITGGGLTLDSTNVISGNADIQERYSGSIIRHYYAHKSSSQNFTIVSRVKYILSDIYTGGYLNKANIQLSNSTITDMSVSLDAWQGNVWTYYSVRLDGSNIMINNFKANNVCVALSGVNITFNNSKFNNMRGNARAITAVGALTNLVCKDCEFGQIVPNGASFETLPDNYIEAKFENCLLDTEVVADQTQLLQGSRVLFPFYNQESKSNYAYFKTGTITTTGDGLTDTTTRTPGAGKFAMRFEPVSKELFEFSSTIPTGNIKNKTMTVAVWCKINSDLFYQDEYQLPRLAVKFDNQTVVSKEAKKTTSWQLIPVSFTPLTEYGQVEVTFSAETDKTGSDAYVYFDDFSTLFPGGYQLDTQGFDLWANALPVAPYLSTNLSAKDVWTALETDDYGENSMGERVKKGAKIKYIADGIPLYE